MKITKKSDRRWIIDFNCRGHRINQIVEGDRRSAEAHLF